MRRRRPPWLARVILVLMLAVAAVATAMASRIGVGRDVFAADTGIAVAAASRRAPEQAGQRLRYAAARYRQRSPIGSGAIYNESQMTGNAQEVTSDHQLVPTRCSPPAIRPG